MAEYCLTVSKIEEKHKAKDVCHLSFEIPEEGLNHLLVKLSDVVEGCSIVTPWPEETEDVQSP
jgi:hypothetical protein